MNTAVLPLESLQDALTRHGHAFVRAADMRELLSRIGSLSDWNEFTKSWNDLALDTYMADQGRYRHRRHAVYAATAGKIEREPHQPHHQSVDYNPLHGGIDRWFEPITESIGNGSSLQTILGFCRQLFGRLSPSVSTWRVEVHQFRIEARADAAGQPTPEGMHRDGVDYVLVLLIKRENIESGTTMIRNIETLQTSRFTLTEPFDAALVDDIRVYHGVTPVEPQDPTRAAYRDVLVVTFRRND